MINYVYPFLPVTGINLHLITPIVCIVCIFYTTLVSMSICCSSLLTLFSPVSNKQIAIVYKRLEMRSTVSDIVTLSGLNLKNSLNNFMSPAPQGGLKAVVWTDTLQTVLMYFGVIFVLGYGTWRLGGISNVLSINKEGDRLDFFK